MKYLGEKTMAAPVAAPASCHLVAPVISKNQKCGGTLAYNYGKGPRPDAFLELP